MDDEIKIEINLNSFFAFKLFDLVRHKAIEKSNEFGFEYFMIVERHLNECEGGIQIEYTLRPIHHYIDREQRNLGFRGYIRMKQGELVALEKEEEK